MSTSWRGQVDCRQGLTVLHGSLRDTRVALHILPLTNPRNAVATLSAALTNTFPAGMVVATPPSAATTCANGSASATAGGSTLTLNAGSRIAANASCTVSVDVKVAEPVTYTNAIAAGVLQANQGDSPAAAIAALRVTAPACWPAQLLSDPGLEGCDGGLCAVGAVGEVIGDGFGAPDWHRAGGIGCGGWLLVERGCTELRTRGILGVLDHRCMRWSRKSPPFSDVGGQASFGVDRASSLVSLTPIIVTPDNRSWA